MPAPSRRQLRATCGDPARPAGQRSSCGRAGGRELSPGTAPPFPRPPTAQRRRTCEESRRKPDAWRSVRERCWSPGTWWVRRTPASLRLFLGAPYRRLRGLPARPQPQARRSDLKVQSRAPASVIVSLVTGLGNNLHAVKHADQKCVF